MQPENIVMHEKIVEFVVVGRSLEGYAKDLDSRIRDPEVLDGALALIAGAGVLYPEEKGSGLAAEPGLEYPLPRVDVVLRLDGRAVAPRGVLESDLDAVIVVGRLVEYLYRLCLGVHDLAVRVIFEQSFVNEAEDLLRFGVKIAVRGIVVRNFLRKINGDRGTDIFLFARRFAAAPRERGDQENRRKDDSQCFFHICSMPFLQWFRRPPDVNPRSADTSNAIIT